MEHHDIIKGLQELGARCPVGSRIVLAGSSALILTGHIHRATDDADVVISEPKLSEMTTLIAEIGDQLDLGDYWLSDAAKGYLDVLPADFTSRLIKLAQYGNLSVLVLHRQDVVLMKLYAMRPNDLDDIVELKPTEEEIEFVRSQLDRISSFRPDQALRMQLYLDEVYPLDV